MKGITPQDIAESISPAEELVVAMNVAMINAELIRQRFQGPETFELYLADNLTVGAQKAIAKPYLGHWHNPRIVRRLEGGVNLGWWFMLEAVRAPQE